jgi:hypothetical protein
MSNIKTLWISLIIDEITSTTIANCWNKTNILGGIKGAALKQNVDPRNPNNQDWREELDILADLMKEANLNKDDLTAIDYLHLEDVDNDEMEDEWEALDQMLLINWDMIDPDEDSGMAGDDMAILGLNTTEYWDGDTLQLSQIEDEVRLTPRKIKALQEARDRIDTLLGK